MGNSNVVSVSRLAFRLLAEGQLVDPTRKQLANRVHDMEPSKWNWRMIHRGIDRLIDRGTVELAPDETGKRNVVRFTDAGVVDAYRYLAQNDDRDEFAD